MTVLHDLGHALELAGGMARQIAWSLILGFTLAAVGFRLVLRRRLLDDARHHDNSAGRRAVGRSLGTAACSWGPGQGPAVRSRETAQAAAKASPAASSLVGPGGAKVRAGREPRHDGIASIPTARTGPSTGGVGTLPTPA